MKRKNERIKESILGAIVLSSILSLVSYQSSGRRDFERGRERNLESSVNNYTSSSMGSLRRIDKRRTMEKKGEKTYRLDNFKSDSDKVLLARLVYGEARNCSDEEKAAVAYTVVNRAMDGKKWNGETIRESILKPWQYSCFNKNDPNREKLMDPEKNVFENCLRVADRVLKNKNGGLNKGQTNYHTKSVRPRWSFSPKMKKIKFGEKFKHLFYREK